MTESFNGRKEESPDWKLMVQAPCRVDFISSFRLTTGPLDRRGDDRGFEGLEDDDHDDDDVDVDGGKNDRVSSALDIVLRTIGYMNTPSLIEHRVF